MFPPRQRCRARPGSQFEREYQRVQPFPISHVLVPRLRRRLTQQSVSQPSGARASTGGLVVYEDGKVIYPDAIAKLQPSAKDTPAERSMCRRELRTNTSCCA